MSDSDSTTGGDEQTDPRLVDVVWSKNRMLKQPALLHRRDREKACGNRPETRTSTDLVTAAVTDGHELCDGCEWPDGAQAVLDERYEDTGSKQ